jgi:predicted NBD/HSP70 family sugar kinase
VYSISANGASAIGDLFQVFRDGSRHTRSDLSTLTGLSRNTVSSRIEPLLTSGLLIEVGPEASSGGRPPVQIAMNPDAASVLAVDIGYARATVALTNLAATVVGLETTEIDLAQGPETVLETAFELGRRLIARASDRRLLGLGIGLPGPVNYLTGQPVSTAIASNWEGFDVPSYARRAFASAVLVDRDANMMALGERAIRWPRVDDLIFVNVATGLSVGIIAGGQLQRGAQGMAGEVGQIRTATSTRPESLHGSAPAKVLTELASGRAIAAELLARGSDASETQDVVRLIRTHDPLTVAVIRDAGRAIGETLAMLVAALNPSVIVLGGDVAQAGEHMLASVRETVYRRSIPMSTRSLQIVRSVSADRAGVVGASTLVAQHVLSPERVNAMIDAGSVGETAVRPNLPGTVT